MWVLILLFLILLVVTGSLLTVLKVALGVAFGLVLAVAIAVTVFVWWIRRKWRAALAASTPSTTPAPMNRGSSTIEVLPPRPASPPPPPGTDPPRVVDVTPLDQREGSEPD